jgi:hypothetical protein
VHYHVDSQNTTRIKQHRTLVSLALAKHREVAEIRRKHEAKNLIAKSKWSAACTWTIAVAVSSLDCGGVDDIERRGLQHESKDLEAGKIVTIHESSTKRSRS